jgi:hypothetical protein
MGQMKSWKPSEVAGKLTYGAVRYAMMTLRNEILLVSMNLKTPSFSGISVI